MAGPSAIPKLGDGEKTPGLCAGGVWGFGREVVALVAGGCDCVPGGGRWVVCWFGGGVWVRREEKPSEGRRVPQGGFVFDSFSGSKNPTRIRF